MTGIHLARILARAISQATFLLTDVEVRLPLGYREVRHLFLLLFAHLDQFLDRRVAFNLTLQQKQILLRNTSILRSLNSNVHTVRMRHQKLCISGLQSISHLLDIVRWTGARDFASNAKCSMHCHGVPNTVLAEERDSVAFLEAIAFDQSSAEICRSFFYLKPVQALFSDGIGVASELFRRETCYG